MIKIKMVFTTNDAILIFRNAGLTVKMVDYPVHFARYHGEGSTELVPILSVINPKNGEAEKLEIVFNRYIETKKEELFLSPGKMEIYNLFNK